MAVSGTNLYVEGYFGTDPVNLARINTSSGLPDTNWTPNPLASGISISQQGAILPSGSDLYVGGPFQAIGGSYPGAPDATARNGFAFLAVADAPTIVKTSSTNLMILPNSGDGLEIGYFQITAISGATLYQSDGVTPINPGDFITAAQGAAGLIFSGTNGVVTAVAGLNSTSCGAGTAATTLSMNATQLPVFSFSTPTYSVTEETGFVSITINKQGSGAASVHFATANGSAIAGTDYIPTNGTFNFGASQTSTNILIIITNDLTFEGNETFAVKLSSPAGATLAYPSTTTVTILENDPIGSTSSVTGTPLPGPLPLATGKLSLSITSPPTNGLWRLAGQALWQSSGTTVSNLVTGNYRVEFAPVSGYRRPDAMIAAVTSGATLVLTNSYIPTTNSGSGFISLLICPDAVADNVDTNNRGQWRVPGWSDWLNNADFTTNIPVGVYPIEFKDVNGYVTPVAGPLTVYSAVGSRLLGVYQRTNEGLGITPTVVTFQTATNRPYAYVGQIQTELGFGSGVVVLDRVVLTAAHLLFDPQSLAFVNKVRWFFERYSGSYEPVPLIPRGVYVFSSYSAQRDADPDPCVMSVQSQNLDAAALYFLQSAGRGGYSGYLVSDSTTNWLLTSRLKILAGYAMEVVPQTNQGKLLATASNNLAFSQVYTNVYSSTNFSGYPSMSGGPLFVQGDDGNYYPAAIYLGPSLAGTILTGPTPIHFRAPDAGSADGSSVLNIDTTTTDVIDTAAAASSGSPGVAVESQFTTRGAIPSIQSYLTVLSGPDPAIGTGGWSISGVSKTYNTWSNFLIINGSSSYQVQFNCVSGSTVTQYAVPYWPPDEEKNYNNGDHIIKVRWYLPADSAHPFSVKLTNPGNLWLSNAAASNTYQVYYNSDLSTPTTWLKLPGGLVTNTGTAAASIPIRDTTGLVNKRFYRAQWVQCPQ
jgi:hypothetical protein